MCVVVGLELGNECWGVDCFGLDNLFYWVFDLCFRSWDLRFGLFVGLGVGFCLYGCDLTCGLLS